MPYFKSECAEGLLTLKRESIALHDAHDGEPYVADNILERSMIIDHFRVQYALVFKGKGGKPYVGHYIDIEASAFRLLQSLCDAVEDEERVFDVKKVSFIYS